MDHNEIRHILSDYLDGSLPESERSVVEEHLKTCSSCSEALTELQKTVDHLKSIEQLEPPAWMTPKIMAKVREEDAGKKSIWRYWLFPFRFPVETVGVVLLAAAAFFIYRSIQPVNRYSEQAQVRTEAPTTAPLRKQAPAKEGGPPAAPAVPQRPAYKALDMKQEYESTPSAPQMATAPRTQEPAAAMAPERKAPKAGTADRDGTPGLLKEEQAQGGAKTLSSPLKTEPRISLIRVRAQGTKKSFEEIEKAVRGAGGTVSRRDVSSGELTMIVTIDQSKRAGLLKALRSFGKAEERSAAIDGQEGFEIIVSEVP